MTGYVHNKTQEHYARAGAATRRLHGQAWFDWATEAAVKMDRRCACGCGEYLYPRAKEGHVRWMERKYLDRQHMSRGQRKGNDSTRSRKAAEALPTMNVDQWGGGFITMPSPDDRRTNY